MLFMNVYDFDQTIYVSDSTKDFTFYCLGRYPKTWLYLPGALVAFLGWQLRLRTKTQFKERFYRYFRGIPDIDRAVSDFWSKHAKGIQSWYLEIQQPDDLIISASPKFLLTPICNQLGIAHLEASVVNKHTGVYTGENCWGEEKAARFRAVWPKAVIERFYSDSLSDTPMARLAKESYIVQKDKFIPWDEYQAAKNSRRR